ncbi:cytochrome P450 [Arthrobacter sp. D1-29]
MTDPSNSSAPEVLEFPVMREPKCPFNPPQVLIDMAVKEPVSRVRIWDGSTPWLVTGNEELRALAADERVSVNHHLPGYPAWNAGQAAAASVRPDSLINVDGAEHVRLRRMATRAFSFKRVNAMRPVIQRVTDEHIDAILAGPKSIDLVPALALPIPSLMICSLLGVPYEDHDFFEESAKGILDRYSQPEDQARHFSGLTEYMRGLVELRLEEPTEDVVSEFAELARTGEITVNEAVQTCIVLLLAGHETSANMIGLGTLAVLENPEQFAALRESDDPKVIANAVEELLRYLSIIHNGQRRIAVGDIEIAGESIKAGEGIILDFSAGNWDTRVFEEPEVLDLTRDASQHVAFGYGPHVCVGQQLARAELQIVFSTLFRRIPTLKLAVPLDEIEFKHDRLAYGVYSLPVTW